jgi:hypothetical protein
VSNIIALCGCDNVLYAGIVMVDCKYNSVDVIQIGKSWTKTSYWGVYLSTKILYCFLCSFGSPSKFSNSVETDTRCYL